MGEEYLKYFAKYKKPETFANYKEPETSFTDLCEYMANEFGVIDITRQPSIKTIGFYTDSKETVEKIKDLEWITEVTYNGSTS